MTIMDVETHNKYNEIFVISDVCGALLLGGVYQISGFVGSFGFSGMIEDSGT